MVIIPSKDFLDNLARLTNDNHHGEVYYQIAKWGFDNCEVNNVDMTFWVHSVKPYEYYRNVFSMFKDMFSAMNKCHRANMDFHFGNMRYEVGKELEDTIRECFGQKTLDAITEVC